jgi:FG-GAP repeat protein
MMRLLAVAVSVAIAAVAVAQPVSVVRPPLPHEFGTALAPLGDRLLVGEVRSARLVDPFTNTLLKTFVIPGDNSSFYGTVVAGDASIVLVGLGGTAYMFDASTAAVVRTFTSPAGPGDGFSAALAVLGSDVLVGAPVSPAGGIVYLLDGATGAVVRTFGAPTPAAGDGFGSSIAVSGGDILIGAPGDDTDASDSGAAYLFDAGTGGLLQTFANPAPAVEARFGHAVAFGAGGALVGAPGDTFPAAPGAAYAFDAGSGALLATFSTPGTYNLGSSVAWLGDDALVGASTPTAYVFDGSTGAVVRPLTSFPGFSFRFGTPVAVVDGHPFVADSSVTGLGADYHAGAVLLFCGGSIGCGPCETCGPAGTCVVAPHPICHDHGSGRFTLRAVNGARDTSDLVGWSGRGSFDGVFLNGAQSGAGGNLSNPLAAGPDYTLCAYDESGPSPNLLFRATAPAGGICDGEPCWEAAIPCTYYRCGFSYRDAEKAFEGVSRAGAKVLTNDSPTPFQFKLLARGENLSNRPGGLPPLPFPLPVRVQLQVRDGLCWQAEFSTATTNTTFRFRARSD